MSANSVIGIFMLTIAFCLVNYSSSIPVNESVSENTTSLLPIELGNITMPNMTLFMKNQTVNSTIFFKQFVQNSQLISDYEESVKKNIEYRSLLLETVTQLESAQSRIQEVDNIKNKLEAQLADDKLREDNITKENNDLSLKIVELDENLQESQKKISSITGDYNKLNDKYLELNKSYLTNQEKLKNMNDKLEESKNTQTLLDAKILSFSQENEALKNKLSQFNDTILKGSDSLKNCENNVKNLKDIILDIQNSLERSKLSNFWHIFANHFSDLFSKLKKLSKL